MASMEQLNNLDTNTTHRWGVDKKVPIALIFVVIVQTLGFTWGAATLSSNVENHDKALARLEQKFDRQIEKIEEELDAKRDSAVDRREMDKVTTRIDKIETRLLDVERSTFKKK